MRLTTIEERKKYGCEDCLDSHVNGMMCSHKNCPYAKPEYVGGVIVNDGLDQFDNYKQYLKQGGFSQFKRRFK